MKRRTVKKIISAAVTVLLICATVLCLSAIAGSLLNDDPSVFGFRAFYVLSGSMEPTIHESALVLVKRSSSYDIGDVITFTSQNPEIAGSPNTHRIIEIIQNGNKTEYITQGDANPVPDAEHVQFSDIIGKVVIHTGRIEWLGNFLEFLMTAKGFMLVIVIPIVAIVVTCLKDYIKAYKEALEKVREEYAKQLSGQTGGGTDEKKKEKAINSGTRASGDACGDGKIRINTEKTETDITKAQYTYGNNKNNTCHRENDGITDGKERDHEGH